MMISLLDEYTTKDFEELLEANFAERENKDSPRLLL